VAREVVQLAVTVSLPDDTAKTLRAAGADVEKLEQQAVGHALAHGWDFFTHLDGLTFDVKVGPA
jgi:hypothetical protein